MTKKERTKRNKMLGKTKGSQMVNSRVLLFQHPLTKRKSQSVKVQIVNQPPYLFQPLSQLNKKPKTLSKCKINKATSRQEVVRVITQSH